MKLLEQIQTLNFPAPLPPMLLEVEQRFDAPKVADVIEATQRALAQSGLPERMSPGDTVAVGVGSRGIANLSIIVKATVEQLANAGMKPFITPLMGSHGGATVKGQISVLAKLGITGESVGVDIRATMDVAQIGQIPNGPPLYQDTVTAAADHALLINRVKPHTSFRSDIESGLAKMAVIGMGKQQGAATMHGLGVDGLKQFLAPAARIYETNTNLVGGIAIVENAYHQTAEIAALTAAEIGGPREARLLKRAKTLMAGLPFTEIDVLVVRDLGKNISGTGMDTNVIGRLLIPRQPEDFGGPDIAIIAVLDLTDETRGNATGLGLANVTTARVAQKVDWTAFYTNALTSGILNMRRSSLPMTMADDKRALQAAILGCGQPPEAAGLVFIRDTLNLDRLWVSPNLRAIVEAHPRLSIVGEVPLAFAGNGTMVTPMKVRSDE